MISFVLDASMTLAWCFPDEATPFTESVLDRLESGGEEAITNSLWAYEVGNGIRMAERRNRISGQKGAGLLEYVYSLPVEVIEVRIPVNAATWPIQCSHFIGAKRRLSFLGS